jgi:hypothetical protein
MSDNRHISVAMQRLVDFISMVTNSTLLRNNTVTLILQVDLVHHFINATYITLLLVQLYCVTPH